MRGGEYQSFVASQGSVRDFIARALGFDIAIVTISGQAELREPEILADAGISPKNSLLFLDAAQARARLEATPLIKQASVRKLYPNHLVIDLVERAPYALWQKDGQVNIVAADGAVIDQMRDQRFAGLPFVVGEGANERLPEFTALLAAAGELGPKIRAGVLVANRRWNLKMASGVDVMLPETNPQAAVATLVRLQRELRVLDRDVISLDLRLEGRMFARLTEEAAAARARGPSQEGAARHELQAAHPPPRQIPPRRNAVLSVLDVGASKIVCLIARLSPMAPSDSLRGRTHRCKVLGIGHQRSRGVKAGAIVDLDSAENAIRLAIDAAERMAGVEVDSVIVNMTGGRLSSQLYNAKIAIGGKPVSEYDIHRVLEAASAASARTGRTCAACLADRVLARRDGGRARSERHGRRRTSARKCMSPPATARRRAI